MYKDRYIFGVSGGPDSMAMLDMYRHDLDIIVAHVNYHKRESANRDELIVFEYCQRYGIPFFKLDAAKEYSGNFQDYARRVRYDFYKQLCEKHEASGVYVAHQMDDLIETYIMQKEKGIIPYTYGLAGQVEINGVKIIRPLLGYTKQQLLEYNRIHQVPYGIDESNLGDSYKRNRIRHEIVEKLGKEDRERYLKIIEEENRELDKRRKKLIPILEKEYLSTEEWNDLEDKQMYLRLKAAHDLSGDQVKEIIRQLDEAEHPLIRLRDKIITKEYDRIALFTPNDDYSYTMNSIRYFRTDYFQIRDAGSKIEGVTVSKNDYPLTIRNFRQGDRIVMRFGTKAVNRFFIDRKIPLKERLCYPIVTNRLGEVIFVPGLGCDVHHFSESPTFFVIKL